MTTKQINYLHKRVSEQLEFNDCLALRHEVGIKYFQKNFNC